MLQACNYIYLNLSLNKQSTYDISNRLHYYSTSMSLLNDALAKINERPPTPIPFQSDILLRPLPSRPAFGPVKWGLVIITIIGCVVAGSYLLSGNPLLSINFTLSGPPSAAKQTTLSPTPTANMLELSLSPLILTEAPLPVTLPLNTEAAPALNATAAYNPPPSAIDTQGAAIRTFLDTVQVGGVRLTGGRSRALINNRAYFVGERIHPDLPITLLSVRQREVILADDQGNTYTKIF